MLRMTTSDGHFYLIIVQLGSINYVRKVELMIRHRQQPVHMIKIRITFTGTNFHWYHQPARISRF